MKKKSRFSVAQIIYLIVGLILLSGFTYMDSNGYRLYSAVGTKTWSHTPFIFVRHK